MILLKCRGLSCHSYTLYYDEATTTYWVTELFNEPGFGISKYIVSFSLLSEAERFFDLLVAQRDV